MGSGGGVEQEDGCVLHPTVSLPVGRHSVLLLVYFSHCSHSLAHISAHSMTACLWPIVSLEFWLSEPGRSHLICLMASRPVMLFIFIIHMASIQQLLPRPIISITATASPASLAVSIRARNPRTWAMVGGVSGGNTMWWIWISGHVSRYGGSCSHRQTRCLTPHCFSHCHSDSHPI